MSDDQLRFLYNSLRQDIANLKTDVIGLLEKHDEELAKHERDLDELKAFKWKWAGALVVMALFVESAVKFVEHAFK